MHEILPGMLQRIEKTQEKRPDLILAAWPSVIGEKFASMTCAYLFEEGVLHVKVNNATLYSLLSQHERRRLLAALQQRFPKLQIRNLKFRMG